MQTLYSNYAFCLGYIFIQYFHFLLGLSVRNTQRCDIQAELFLVKEKGSNPHILRWWNSQQSYFTAHAWGVCEWSQTNLKCSCVHAVLLAESVASACAAGLVLGRVPVRDVCEGCATLCGSLPQRNGYFQAEEVKKEESLAWVWDTSISGVVSYIPKAHRLGAWKLCE